jgi:hypothetical protein
MDVCWKRKKIKNGTNGSGLNLVAVLVGNYQNEASANARGNFTRQLGTIGEKFLDSKARDMRAFHQGLFWLHVDKKLNHLSLSSQERKKIELKISKTVPRPGQDWALWSVTCIPRYDP